MCMETVIKQRALYFFFKKSYLCFSKRGLEERLPTQFNRLFRLGVKEVGDIVDAPSQRILEFVEARQLLRISPNYGFI